jgi:putative hydrolase of the HAD superfamily
MTRHLRAVLFDIDDTLYSTTEFAAKARRGALQAMIDAGLRSTLDDLQRELAETIAEFGSNYEHHYEKLLERLPASSTRGLNRAVLVASGVAAYHDAKFNLLRPFPDVIPAFKAMSHTYLVRGIVTDGLAIKQAEKLIRLGIYPLLSPQAIFISDQIGISKPNPKIFARACADLDLPPAEVLIVGDHPVKDIDAANAAGCITALVKRGGRHQDDRGRTKPDFTLRDLKQLLTVLARRFKVRTSSAPSK